jgi:hypothetical protein
MSRRAIVPVLLAVLVAVLTGSVPAAAADDQWRADRVLSVGVPGLVWSDLDPAATPHLWSLAQDSAIGALSVRAGRSTTCLLDGWATLGAGNRARYPSPVEPIPAVPPPVGDGTGPAGESPAEAVDTRLSYCGLEEQVAKVGLAEPERTVARVAADEATARFGAEPGALGQAVSCSSAVGRAALHRPGHPACRRRRADHPAAAVPVDAGVARAAQRCRRARRRRHRRRHRADRPRGGRAGRGRRGRPAAHGHRRVAR